MDLGLIRNDFRFLSDKITATNKAFKKLDLISKNTYKQAELVRFKILKTHATKRGTSLRLVPCIFEKHRNNISFFLMKEKLIFWTIDISFVKFDSDNKICYQITKIINPISEESSISDIFEEVAFENPKLFDFFANRYDKNMLTDDINNKKYSVMLEYYKYTDGSEVIDNTRTTTEIYEEIDVDRDHDNINTDTHNYRNYNGRLKKCLKVFYTNVRSDETIVEILGNKTVVEYPRFMVVKYEDQDLVSQIKEFKVESADISSN